MRDVSRKESRFDSRYALYLGGSCPNPHLCSAVISVSREFYLLVSSRSLASCFIKLL